MEPNEYELMYRVEDHHWWYRGMARITHGILRKELALAGSCRVLDAGCGTGAFMREMQASGTVTGVDRSELALEFCRRRGLTRVTQASVTELPFPDHCFDLVTSFDVLSECPVGQDMQGLVEFRRVLQPGGLLLLRLPAYNWLRGKHDAAVHTQTRYSKSMLRRRLLATGFRVKRMSYANMWLFPAVAAKRLSERVMPSRSSGSDVKDSRGLVNGALTRLLGSEAALVRSVGLPFGLTLVALAEAAGD